MKEEQDRTPLRTILQNFINHIESLEIQNVEDRYEKEFQVLIFYSKSQNIVIPFFVLNNYYECNKLLICI
jgi:hypothetical protein